MYKIKLLLILFFIIIIFPGYCQVWRGLGSIGADFNVEAFAIDSAQNLLYVGGGFDHIDGMNITAVAVWDSVQWHAVGNNEVFKNPGSVNALTFFNGDLIAGGKFDSIGNQRMNNIAKWNGSNWEPMGLGFDGVVEDVCVFQQELYACGTFFFSGTDTVRTIAKWNGTGWVMAAPGINDYVFTLTVYHNKLIIGGQFIRINGNNLYSVAAWDGISWSQVGTGFNNQVFILKNINDTLYAGGNFTGVPGNQSYWISKFDGQNWQPMPYPTGGANSVTDITWFNNHLFVSGYFNNPEDIGIFNGVSYDSAGGATGFITSMCVYKNELYVGGNFIQIAGVTTTCIARLNYNNLSGIWNIISGTKINIYPNPVYQGQTVTMHSDDLSKKSLYSIVIYTLDGKLIREQINESLPFIIETKNLHPACYLVEVKSESGIYFVSRLIVLP